MIQKSRNLIIAFLSSQLLMWVVVIWDIPIARQVVGFLYFTFVPGIVFLKILKLRDLDFARKLLLSVGLSVFFLMITGLLTNEFLPLIGISKPLSEMNLMVTTNGALLLLFFLSLVLDKDFKSSFTHLKDGMQEAPLYILLACIVLLSVVGTASMNAYGDNFLLLLMIILIAGLVFLSTLFLKLLSPRSCAFVLLSIAVALLFQKSLISGYIHGRDIHGEYFVSRFTERNSYWHSNLFADRFYGVFSSMLSVTVLPTVYSNILKIDVTWIFKILFPLIYAFVPLGLYKLYRTQMNKKISFLSTLFFIANYDFFVLPTSNGKQMIAELFYVLLLLVLFDADIKDFTKKACFIFFSIALVTSHYATSYIFLFLIFCTMLSMFFMKKGRKITPALVLLFFAIAFSWNIYLAKSASFDTLVIASNQVYSSLSTELFNPQSRGEEVLKAIGLQSPQTFLYAISRTFFYITEIFILLGFFALIIKQRKMKLDPEYSVIITVNMIILAMTIVVPRFASQLRMERFYNILLLVLAPLFVLGGHIFLEIMLKSFKKGRLTKYWSLILISLVLLPFFLFQIGFMYEVAGDYPSSVSLSKYRMGEIPYISYGLVHESDVFGAEWLSKNADMEHTQIYSDVASEHVLISYGMINRTKILFLSNNTEPINESYIFLWRYNVINGIIITEKGSVNTTDLSPIFSSGNKIYSSGACEIYKNDILRGW